MVRERGQSRGYAPLDDNDDSHGGWCRGQEGARDRLGENQGTLVHVSESICQRPELCSTLGIWLRHPSLMCVGHLFSESRFQGWGQARKLNSRVQMGG